MRTREYVIKVCQEIIKNADDMGILSKINTWHVAVE